MRLVLLAPALVALTFTQPANAECVCGGSYQSYGNYSYPYQSYGDYYPYRYGGYYRGGLGVSPLGVERREFRRVDRRVDRRVGRRY
jgi:hypothetical protein